MGWHVRGTRLPERVPVEFWTDAARISFRPVTAAKTLADGGFVLPGLADAHTHPGAPVPGEPLDEEVLRADLVPIRSSSITQPPPCWFTHQTPGILPQSQAPLPARERGGRRSTNPARA